MNTEEAPYLLALRYCKGIGDILGKRLIEAAGGAKTLWKNDALDLLKVSRVGPHAIQDIGRDDLFSKAAREVDRAREMGWKVLCYSDAGYPSLLKHCADAPLLVFQKGAVDFSQDRKTISVVGTRRLTDYGREFTAELVAALAAHQPIVVSGLAYGADAAAHQAALENQLDTVGVLAHGLDRVYPHEHKALAEKMCEAGGGLISEYTSLEPVLKENFLLRNRIVAGLSQATIIIETGLKGGAITTAEYANAYNRDVFALPGSVKAFYSAGCNHLIKTHRAHLITSAKDVEHLLNWSVPPQAAPKTKETQLFDAFEEGEEDIYAYLSEKGRQQFDEISHALDLPVHRLMSLLLSMELKGFIKALSGKYFEAVRN